MVVNGLGNSIDISSNTQNSSSERKVYIDRKTGDIVDTINSAELANYIETDTKQTIYIDMEKEFSDGNNAVSTDAGEGKKLISVMQYTQYKLLSQFGKNRYENIVSTEEKKKIIQKAISTIVDNNIDLPQNLNELKLLKIEALINVMGQTDVQILLNNKSTIQEPVDDNKARLDALMNQLYENTEEKPSNSEASEQNNTIPKGFFKMKVYKKDTGLFWRPRLLGNTTQIIDDKEYQGPTMMLSGNGFSFRGARTNVLVNKMITKLEGNDPDVVIAEIFGFTKRSFGTGRRLVHKTKLFHNLKDPIKFDEKFQKRLAEYREYRLRNLDPNEQEAIIQAINNAKNAYIQQHINQAQSIMR